MAMSLFGEDINHINAKLHHFDVSTISVSETNDSVSSYPCTDTNTWKQRHRHSCRLVVYSVVFNVSVIFAYTDTDEIKRCGTHFTIGKVHLA